MAKNRVTLELSVAEAKAFQAFQAMTGAIKQMGSALGQAAGQGAQFSSSAAGGFADVAKTVAQVGLAFMGMRSPLQALTQLGQLLRTELEAIRQFQLSSGQYQVDVGKSVQQMLYGTPLHAEVSKYIDMTAGQLERYATTDTGGIEPTSLAQVVKHVIGTGITLPISMRAAIGKMTTKTFPSYSEEDWKSIGAAVQTWIEAYGPTSEQVFAMSQLEREKLSFDFLGYMSTAISEAYVSDPGKFAENLAPMIALAKERGFGLREAAAFGITMTQRIKDVSGRISGTQMEVLTDAAYQVAEALGLKHTGGLDIFRAIADSQQAQGYFMGVIAKKMDLTEEEQRLFSEAIRAGVEQGKAISLDRIPGRARTAQASREFLMRGREGTPTMQMLEQLLDTLPGTPEEAGQRLRRRMGEVRLLPTQRAYAFHLGGEEMRQTQLMDRSVGALGQVVKLMTDQAAINPFFGSSVTSLRARLMSAVSTGTPEASVLAGAADWIRGEMRGLDLRRYPRTILENSDPSMFTWVPRDTGPRKFYDYEARMMESFEKMLKAIQEQLQILKKLERDGMPVEVTKDATRTTPSEPRRPPVRSLSAPSTAQPVGTSSGTD